MKKYLLGLFAIVLAVGFSAFTMPKKAKTVNEFFSFNYALGSSLSQTDVQTESLWIYAATQNLTTGCSGSANQACKIEVDPAYIDNSVSPHVLNSSASIIAVKGASNVRYVPDGGTSSTIVGQRDKN